MGRDAAWSVVPGADGLVLNSVWGSGPSDVWAVGLDANDPGFESAVHWSGSSWQPVTVPTPFFSIAGDAADDVWATANGGIYHWNGSSWSASAALVPANGYGPPTLVRAPVGGIWQWAQLGSSTAGVLYHP